MKYFDSIKANETIRHTGPVTISGDIGEGACIIIDSGSLVVDGSVGTNVTITSNAGKNNANCIKIPTSDCMVVINSGSHSDIDGTDGSVTINGDIADDVIVNCDGDFTCKGTIADQFTLKAKNSNITLSDIGENSNITVDNGNITAQEIGSNTKIIAKQGNIKALTAKRNSQLTAQSGNITVYTAEANTLLAAPNGMISCANAVKTATLKAKNYTMQDNGISVPQKNDQCPDVIFSEIYMNNKVVATVTEYTIHQANHSKNGNRF